MLFGENFNFCERNPVNAAWNHERFEVFADHGKVTLAALRLIDLIPRGSMGLVYLPTQMLDFYDKCRQIYHTWIAYGIVDFLFFF